MTWGKIIDRWERPHNYITEFDTYIDNIFLVFMFYVNILSLF